MQKIGIIGAGAWGTALATATNRAGRNVLLWAREAELVKAINTGHENTTYLAGIALDEGIQASTDLEQVVDADAVLAVCPAQHFRSVLAKAAAHWKAGVPLVICAKGIEQETQALMAEVVSEVLPTAAIAVLSGPTFAKEVAADLPTAVTLATKDAELGNKLAQALRTPKFRIYTTDDVTGAEIGGAVKYVHAIGCGIVEGKGLGDNARAALITRGLAEIARLSSALGGRPETLLGLSGIGDVTLTCNAMQSRNFSLGFELGQGKTLEDIMGGRHTVAEGVTTAASVTKLADNLGIDMPIANAVKAILHDGIAINDAIYQLLARPTTPESLI